MGKGGGGGGVIYKVHIAQMTCMYFCMVKLKLIYLKYTHLASQEVLEEPSFI